VAGEREKGKEGGRVGEKYNIYIAESGRNSGR
jgi:hypothetical protein